MFLGSPYSLVTFKLRTSFSETFKVQRHQMTSKRFFNYLSNYLGFSAFNIYVNDRRAHQETITLGGSGSFQRGWGQAAAGAELIKAAAEKKVHHEEKKKISFEADCPFHSRKGWKGEKGDLIFDLKEKNWLICGIWNFLLESWNDW